MAATTDLINPIRLPNGIDTANNNPSTRSDKVIRQGLGRNVETSLVSLEAIGIAYSFNTTVIDTTDPGSGGAALNNANKDDATILTLSTTSANGSARFDQLLNGLTTGDRIYLQERDTPATNILFRVTGATNLIGTRVNIPVVREQPETAGAGTFTNNGVIAVNIFFTRAISASGLPQPQQDWLAQTASQQLSTTTVTNINDTVTDVLIWRRAALVNNAIISDPGVGLRIDEANRQADGTFDRPSGTAVYDDDQSNAYIYVGITDGDFAGLDTANTFLEARRDGELIFSSSLDDLTTPTQVTSGQFTYRRTTNNQYHYIAGDVLTVVTRATSQTTQYNYNTPAGDFTQNIANLPFSAVDDQFTARVNGPADNQVLTAADRVKLTGLLVQTTTTAGQSLTVLYKDGNPSANVADYNKTWNAANPVLANFGTQRIVSILVDNNVTVSSVSGGATLGPQLLWIPGKYIYQVTLPAEVSTGTPTSHLPTGVIEAFLPIGLDSNYKIVRANVEANLLALIDAHGTAADISSLETKVNNLFPLTPDVGILNDWSDIYDPIHGAATVDILDGYSRIADYRSDTDRYESAGVIYATGTNVITYTGLTNDLHRSFGFKVTAASDKILMWIVDGSTNIPLVDITAAGNIRVNNYTPEEIVDQLVSNQVHFLTRTGGTQIVTTAPGSFARFQIPNFPSGSTQRSRNLEIEVNVYVNGVDTLAGRGVNVEIPVANIAQAKQTIDDNVYLGPLYGNRTVNLTIGYEFVVDGANLVVDLTLESAPSDVTVDFEPSTAAYLTYTAQSVTARVDNFLNLNDGAGDYTFTGEQEFILSMRPVIGISGEQTGYLEVVPAAVGADGDIDQLNDTDIRIPTPIWDEIVVADDIEFRTFEADHYFRHSEVAGLLRQRGQKWAYGIARLQTANAGHSITEPVDLATGSTLNGVPISTNGSRTWRDSQSFTAAATNLTVNLPVSTTLSTFVFVEITWHTGVGTATDNDNRNYSEMGSMQSIIDMTDAELILGGRGRGAENYGIEIDQPTAGTDTSLTMSIINLNDLGGANLPAGSLITAVRFY